MSWKEKAAAEGGFVFAGAKMQQHPDALVVLPDLILNAFGDRPGRVVELGTAGGCLAVYLKQVLPKAEVMTYGIHTVSPTIAMLMDQLGVRLRVQDIFEEKGKNMVREDLSYDGPVFLICDNGDKILEVNTFGQDLKSGDVMVCHDYRNTKEEPGAWQWVEITRAPIADTLDQCGFEPFMEGRAAQAGFGSFRKR